MKSCLKCTTDAHPRDTNSPPPESPSEQGSDCDAPTTGSIQRRKSVAFCEVGEENVFYVDNWDRSPAAVTERLTYQDVYELKEMRIALPRIQLAKRKSELS